jgi:hypothetical protein
MTEGPLSPTYRNFLQRRRSARPKRNSLDFLRVRRDEIIDRSAGPAAAEMPLISTHICDIKRYRPNVDEKAVAAIIQHLGIKNADAPLISCSDQDEIARVRNSWLKKKLALTHNDAKLDRAISDMHASMQTELRISRVTLYYLLAEKFGRIASLAR